MLQIEPDRLLTIGEVAQYFNVSVDTIRRWTKDGKLKAYRAPGGKRRYKSNEIEKALKDFKEDETVK